MSGYRVISKSLTTARDNERIDVNARYIAFTQVPADVTVRLGDASNPPITVATLGSALDCGGKIGSIFLTNAQGSGILEILVSETLRLDFNTPGSSANELKHTRDIITAVPGAASATLINQAQWTTRDDAAPMVAGQSWGSSMVEQTGHVNSGAEVRGWSVDMWGDSTNSDQSYLARLQMVSGREPYIPLETILSPVTGKYLGALPWFETETDIYLEHTGFDDLWFRFGIGNTIKNIAQVDAFVGFAMGKCSDWVRLDSPAVTADGDLVAFCQSDDETTQVVHHNELIATDANARYMNLRVRIGAPAGTPVIEWYVDDVLAASVTGAAASAFRTGNTLGFAYPVLAVGRFDAAACEFRLRWAHGGGWSFRRYWE